MMAEAMAVLAVDHYDGCLLFKTSDFNVIKSKSDLSPERGVSVNFEYSVVFCRDLGDTKKLV